MRAMRIAAALLVVAACGGGTKPVDPKPEPKPSTPYAAMFESGRTFTFATEYSESTGEESEEEQMGAVKGTATCTVAEVVAIADGQASRIACEFKGEMIGTDPLTGTWISAPGGLYKGDELPAAGATVETKWLQLVLGNPPAPFQEDIVEEDENETEGSGVVALRQEGDAWCWSYSVALGDEIWQSLCFGPEGLRSGDFGWAGGSVHSTKFTVAK